MHGWGKILPALLPPASVVCEGYVFTGVCLSTGGICLWSRGDVCHTHTHTHTHTYPGRHPPAQCMLGYTHPCPVHAGIHTPPCPVHAGIHTPLPSACWDTHTPCPVHAGIHAPPLCTVHAGIRSTSGRYASHWNAFLWFIYTKSDTRISPIYCAVSAEIDQFPHSSFQTISFLMSDLVLVSVNTPLRITLNGAFILTESKTDRVTIFE